MCGEVFATAHVLVMFYYILYVISYALEFQTLSNTFSRCRSFFLPLDIYLTKVFNYYRLFLILKSTITVVVVRGIVWLMLRALTSYFFVIAVQQHRQQVDHLFLCNLEQSTMLCHSLHFYIRKCRDTPLFTFWHCIYAIYLINAPVFFPCLWYFS